MSSFEVTSANFPQNSTAELPQYIQFRLNGVDIGGPTVTVVDFVGASFVVTRGTGADVNKLTVSLG